LWKFLEITLIAFNCSDVRWGKAGECTVLRTAFVQTIMVFLISGVSVCVMALLCGCGQTWLSVHAQMTPLLDPAEINGEFISDCTDMTVSNKL